MKPTGSISVPEYICIYSDIENFTDFWQIWEESKVMDSNELF